MTSFLGWFEMKRQGIVRKKRRNQIDSGKDITQKWEWNNAQENSARENNQKRRAKDSKSS